MSSPPASSAKSSAVAAAAAAAAALRAQGSSLPFSIEQILSSPIKPSHGPMSAVEQLGAMEPAARQLADLMAASQPAHMMAAHQLLNPLAMATGGDNILQYFMAYMLSSIQQQQQQHHINNNNSTSAGQQQLMGIQSPLSQLKSSQHHLAQQQQQQSHHQAQQQLLAAAQLAAAQQQIQAAALNYPLNPLSSTAGGLPNPLLSCFTNCMQPQPPHLLQQQQQPPPPPRHHQMHQSPPIEQTVSRSASFLPSAKLISSQRSSYSAGYKSTSSAGHQTNNKTSASSKLTASGHEQSTALSSLSNFVTESLAPILNGDNNNKSAYSKQSAGSDHSFGSSSKSPPANKSSGGLQNGKPLIGSSNHGTTTTSSSQRKSPDEAQLGNLHQHHLSNHKVVGESGRPNSSTLDLISSAALALKGAGAATAPVAPNATTINATLAKAPPELVQKQPAWVFCTRYSDRPSSGPRTRRAKSKDKKAKDPKAAGDDKRPRTAFTSEQLESLRREFLDSPYLDEKRRKDLADRLCLNENQIKIWFQNKRAKQKKQNNQPSPLRGLLVAGGLYNHSTATSDCSESYANGNDHENDDDDADNDCGDRNDLNDGSKNNNCNNIGKNKRSRNQQDNDGNLNFRNEDDTGMREPSNKRARLSNSGSESGSDCSRIEDLDDDEQVISVS